MAHWGEPQGGGQRIGGAGEACNAFLAVVMTPVGPEMKADRPTRDGS